MKLSAKLLDGIRLWLDSIPLATLRRGGSYFQNGAVHKLECVEPGQLYVAVVRGGREYEARLVFGDGGWSSECACPVGFDCKHGVAAMMCLQQQAEEDEGTGSESRPARGRKNKTSPSTGRKPPRVPQPPRSPLADRLGEKLGRDLLAAEGQFICRVQAAFATARLRALAESDLGQIVGHYTAYDYWKPLELWPDLPADDFWFWQFIAWELRRRGWKYPQGMEAITDPELIRPAMEAWVREKEIGRWKDWFRGFGGTAPASAPSVLELRLAVFPDEARLQWRTDSGQEFAELKKAQAQKFSERFEQGTLSFTPDSLPLWSATFKHWSYDSWWSFKYANAAARPALNRLLRMPLPPDRIVTADGRPLVRAEAPLRLDLRPPQNGGDSYELALVSADGSPAPPVYCQLPGHPALYLTAHGLFAGPPPDLPGTASRQAIPAPALETADGLHFLLAATVPLPEHLAQRVKTVPVTVTIICELKRPYPESQTEDIVLTVETAAPGMKPEHFTSQGWEVAPGTASPRTAGGASPGPDAGPIISVHDRAAQKHFPGVLDALPGLKAGGYRYNWHLRLGKKTPELFAAWLKSLPPEIEIKVDAELATLRDAPVVGAVSLDVTEAGIDWFDLKVALNVTDTTLTPGEIELLFNARGGFVRLGRKGWRRLQFDLTTEDEEHLARLGLDARDFSAEPQRFHALQLADEAAGRFLAPDCVAEIRRRADELKARVAPPLPPVISARLRPYQTEGFHFLAYLSANRFGGVLADDMGLGKTVQTLAWLAWLRDGGDQPSGGSSPPLPALVVCPKSVMDNWRAEAERFYPGLGVCLWRGEDAGGLAAARESSGLIVINYSQLRALSPAIAGLPWLAAILDEAQYIKNPDSQTAQAARALQAGHRLALTGTPIENRLLDLWSILSYAMPGALGGRTHFQRRFNAKDDPLARRRLAARVRPFLLRRTKSQVAKDLPDRIEEDWLCEMEGEQLALYRAQLKHARQILLKLKTSRQLDAERFNILTELLRLRQICCHPALVNPELRAAGSAKVSALEDLLEPLMEEGHKVLVFSQFVGMLEILRETAAAHGWPHYYLAGDTENRGDLVREFQAAPGGAVFLISLKAGGFGLNLTAASYVVLFDPWWNPAVENQAIDRTHRIGQTSKVIAYRLLMRESIEEKIRALQKQKAALAGDVLGEERFSQSLTLDDLRFLFAE